jgi:SPX domain-containing protein involved in vacuolar polyphosphate accumulation
MKFGKSLSEKVRDDWKEFAVDYKGMKKVLPKDDDLFIPTYETDKVELPDDGKEGIDCSPDSLYPEYWRLYQHSLEAISNFYNQKSSWAQSRFKSLQGKVDKYRLAKLPGSSLSADMTADELKAQVIEFKTELEYVRQFLAINYTAFSKILKKYDKRTLSSLRDKKLEELLRDKPFLDGSTLEPLVQNAKNLVGIVDGLDGRPRTTSTTSTRSVGGARSPGGGDVNDGTIGSVYPGDGSVFTSCSMTRGEASLIYEQAKKILDKIETSPFFTKYKAKPVPRFLPEEVESGVVLGEGEFSIVREVKAFDVDELCPICVIHRFKDSSDVSMEASAPSNERNDRDDKKKVVKVEVSAHAKALMRSKDSFIMSIKGDDVSDLDMESFQDDHEEEDNEVVASRGFMKHHCFRDGSARYAVKQLKGTLTGSKRADGAIDLSIEAKFLSVLSHPNIIRLCGIGGARGHHRSFLVLDRLYDTLDIKIEYWRKKEDEYKGFFGLSKKHKSQQALMWKERLLAGFDIGRAMKYLHGHE